MTEISRGESNMKIHTTLCLKIQLPLTSIVTKIAQLSHRSLFLAIVFDNVVSYIVFKSMTQAWKQSHTFESWKHNGGSVVKSTRLILILLSYLLLLLYEALLYSMLSLPHKVKTRYLHLDHTKSTFFRLGKFLKWLAHDQSSSIPNGSIYMYCIKHNYVHTTF